MSRAPILPPPTRSQSIRNDFCIRKIGPSDQPAWRALRLEGLETEPLAFLTTASEQRARSADQDRELLSTGNWRGLFSGTDLVAQAALIPMPRTAARHRMEIGAFYVTATARGTGAAAALIESLATEAQDCGALQLELSVAADNPRAIRFYERHGFERFGTQPRAIIADGRGYDDYFYVRFLDKDTK